MNVISIFDRTGNMVKPWADAGYLCHIVDIAHEPGEHRDGNVVRIGADVRTWLPPRGDIAAAFFFPPCTDLAVSGARWFRGKGLFSLASAIELFAHAAKLAEWTGAPYLIENPVSTISTYWRKPDHVFDPCDYAGYPGGGDDLYTKRTCLWVGGGFTMPPKRRLDPIHGSRMHLLPPSADRAALRSATPHGFATAVFEHLTGQEHVA